MNQAIKVFGVGMQDNEVDHFTKALPRDSFQELRRKVGQGTRRVIG